MDIGYEVNVACCKPDKTWDHRSIVISLEDDCGGGHTDGEIIEEATDRINLELPRLNYEAVGMLSFSRLGKRKNNVDQTAGMLFKVEPILTFDAELAICMRGKTGTDGGRWMTVWVKHITMTGRERREDFAGTEVFNAEMLRRATEHTVRRDPSVVHYFLINLHVQKEVEPQTESDGEFCGAYTGSEPD